MKIQRIIRNQFVPERRRFRRSSSTVAWERGEDEELVELKGISVSSEEQLRSVLRSVLQPGRRLVATEVDPDEDFKLREDESRELSNFRQFEEIDSEGQHTHTLYLVELDLDDEPRREQVSLTLSSHILRYLRIQAAKSQKSLSRYIDEMLASSLQTDSAATKDLFEESLIELEDLTQRWRKRLEEALNSKKLVFTPTKEPSKAKGRPPELVAIIES